MKADTKISEDSRDWRKNALCQTNPELFAYPDGRRSNQNTLNAGKRVCETCPVISYCALDFLESVESGFKPTGVWAGEAVPMYFYSRDRTLIAKARGGHEMVNAKHKTLNAIKEKAKGAR